MDATTTSTDLQPEIPAHSITAAQLRALINSVVENTASLDWWERIDELDTVLGGMAAMGVTFSIPQG